ncbi:MAG: zf-TFIIB domain-containing protein [Sphingomonas sp.]|uniref:TFIIB-type zinc ribbon-containing protein n=1 Tax=Sphingomonas sp. TaxID=28214 RepID=UPI0025E2CABC|nr:zf-TFIIB domain-containing protein [Sphingomonas sp.]MBY0282760.1 zf-TFIIB domain-containing protein [Sphingomonas sp.]
MRTAETVAVMPCPVCKTGLSLSDRQGVEIDYCPTCRGVWLDRGELDKIIERSVEDTAPARRSAEPPSRESRPTGYDHFDDDDGRYRRGKRKKSFLSELFD